MSRTSARFATLLLIIGVFGFERVPVEAAPAPSSRPARSQESRSPLQGDSTDLRELAEEAQARFEENHRQLLSYTLSGDRGSCRERIGRLCIWHEGDDDWVPVPDSPDIVQARDLLLRELAEIGGQLPGDGWILGQRIRYLSEAGRWTEAVDLTRNCTIHDRGWCSVLEGFALHGTGLYEAALEAFREGLESMSPEEAIKWRDPRVLLDGRGSDVLDDTEGEDQERAQSKLWTLADPLYLVPGNDRESEHYARWTFSRISDRAESVWGMRWGDDLEEITVRYGWNRGWERSRPQIGTSSAETIIIGHQLSGGKEFVPPGLVLEKPWETEPGSWILDEDDPRSAHVAAYAPNFFLGEAQVAVLHRGESIVVAGATRIPKTLDRTSEIMATSQTRGLPVELKGPVAWPQPALLDGPERAGLFLLGRKGRLHEVSRKGSEGAFELTVPAGDYVVSVEAWSPTEGLAGRLRHGISADTIPDDLATLSDLILLDLGKSLPQDFDVALPMMRPSNRLRANERIALGWEMFGLGWRQEDIEFELSFYREGKGFFGRIGRWLGFSSREDPLRIAWEEPGPSEVGPWFRSIQVTPPSVEPGLYIFRLEVTTRGRETLVQTRVVEIFR